MGRVSSIDNVENIGILKQTKGGKTLYIDNINKKAQEIYQSTGGSGYQVIISDLQKKADADMALAKKGQATIESLIEKRESFESMSTIFSWLNGCKKVDYGKYLLSWAGVKVELHYLGRLLHVLISEPVILRSQLPKEFQNKTVFAGMCKSMPKTKVVNDWQSILHLKCCQCGQMHPVIRERKFSLGPDFTGRAAWQETVYHLMLCSETYRLHTIGAMTWKYYQI